MDYPEQFWIFRSSYENTQFNDKCPGILAKWTMNIGAPYPSSFVSEIIEITPREVADSEFDVIPTNAKIEVVKIGISTSFTIARPKLPQNSSKGEMKNVLKNGRSYKFILEIPSDQAPQRWML